MIMRKQNRYPCKAIQELTKYNDKYKKSVKPCLLKNSERHCSYCDEYFRNQGNLVISTLTKALPLSINVSY